MGRGIVFYSAARNVYYGWLAGGNNANEGPINNEGAAVATSAIGNIGVSGSDGYLLLFLPNKIQINGLKHMGGN